MAAQSEWTTQAAEPETYPGVLQGYRHFGRPLLFKGMAELCSVHSKFEYPIIGKEEWWEADCGTTDTLRISERKHPVVPASNCRCGFYINYYPENTFYTQEDNLIYPRGVVEASGHLILSTKGFRSQKMRLVALCPIYFGLWKYVEQNFPWVKLYDDPDEMYETHPQADLTSLIGEDLLNSSKSSVPFDSNSVTTTINHALSRYGAVAPGYMPAPAAPGSTIMPIRHLVALAVGQGLIYQGSLYDGTKLTIHPSYDHLRLERYDPNYNMFDFSQFGNPHYIGSYSRTPNFVHDIKLTDLNNCMIEVSADLHTMYQLVFDYQGIQYEWNFVNGECKWRKLY